MPLMGPELLRGGGKWEGWTEGRKEVGVGVGVCVKARGAFRG